MRRKRRGVKWSGRGSNPQPSHCERDSEPDRPRFNQGGRRLAGSGLYLDVAAEAGCRAFYKGRRRKSAPSDRARRGRSGGLSQSRWARTPPRGRILEAPGRIRGCRGGQKWYNTPFDHPTYQGEGDRRCLAVTEETDSSPSPASTFSPSVAIASIDRVQRPISAARRSRTEFLKPFDTTESITGCLTRAITACDSRRTGIRAGPV